jgi:Divergent InlB B-repeat domain
MRIRALASIAVLALLATAGAASAFQSPNIIIKVKGGRATVSNNLEPGGCVTATCKLVLGPHQRLTLKAKPDSGYKYKRWEGPCLSTHGYKCTIEGSNHTERFVVRLGRG